MNVLLVNSCTGKKIREPLFPLSLIYIAAQLEKIGHTVEILDIENLWYHNIVSTEADVCRTLGKKASAFKPDIVGFSALFSGSFPMIIPMAEEIKKHNSECITVVGGIHATIFYRDILNNLPQIDLVVTGEGEDAMSGILSSFPTRQWSKISAVAYRRPNGEVILNPRENYITDLDRLPFPAYHLLNFDQYRFDFSAYWNPNNISFDLVAPVLSSRSCPRQCCFCAMHLVMGKKIRYRSPQKVVDEIEMLYDQCGVRYISFEDDNLTMNNDHAIAIFRDIIRRGLKLIIDCQGGVYINSLNRPLLELMKEAGVVFVPLAIEHGDEFIRNKVIKKNLRREKIMEIAFLCRELGIKTSGLFVYGFPEETPEAIRHTYDLIEELPVDIVRIHNLHPFPGTEVFEVCKNEELFTDEIRFDTLWCKEMILDDVTKFYLKPRNMTLAELFDGRKLLDDLVKNKNAAPAH